MSSVPRGRVLRHHSRHHMTELQADRPGQQQPRGEEGRKEDSWGMWLCHRSSDLWSPDPRMEEDRSWLEYGT